MMTIEVMTDMGLFVTYFKKAFNIFQIKNYIFVNYYLTLLLTTEAPYNTIFY